MGCLQGAGELPSCHTLPVPPWDPHISPLQWRRSPQPTGQYPNDHSSNLLSHSREPRSPKSRSGQGRAPSRCSRRESSLPPPSSGGWRPSQAGASVPPVSASEITWPPLLCISKIPSSYPCTGPPFIQHNLVFSWSVFVLQDYVCKVPTSKRGHICRAER